MKQISALRRLVLAFTFLLGCPAFLPASAAPLAVRLTGHLPSAAVAHARPLGRVAPSERIDLALVLAGRNQAELSDLLRHLYAPGDPQQGRFLAPAEYAARFGPTEAEYESVAAFAKRSGFRLTATHPSRRLLDVSGTTSQVEAAFGLHLRRYQSRAGRIFRAPDAEPRVPAALAGPLAGVVGLDTAMLRRPHLTPSAGSGPGSGPNGGLTPADTQKAYGLQGVSASGAGQTLAVFELDGYNASDITAFASTYGLPKPALQNVLIDGVDGSVQSSDGAAEVTLDIELSLAAAPGLSKVLVYETANTDAGVLDGYSRIADDNLAKQGGSAWGGPELQSTLASRDGENQIFQQMAAQGQSFFSAAGDNGAYDDSQTLSVDDPSSQPYITAVGGTTLALNSGGGYGSETTWADPTDTTFSSFGSGGGGGISQVWPAPSYQSALLPAPARRSLPDVALNADPNTGYSVYVAGAWHVYGGTSAAVPFWAGLTARVNQFRAAQGLAPAGFLNPLIYQIGASTVYDADFHDITTGNNLHYPATVGYDNATGWGSPVGSALIETLVNGLPVAAAGTITGTVLAADTGAALAGAGVSASSQAGGTLEAAATTDANGLYALSVPGGLAVSVSVSAYAATGGKYAGAKSDVTAPPGGSAVQNFALRPAHTFAPGIQMLSAPYDYSAVGDFAALLGLTPPLQSPQPRLVHWEPDLAGYVFYPNGSASTPAPGRGYWASFPAASYLHFDGALVPTNQPFALSLPAGWNQIGDPFPAPLPLSALTADGVPLPRSLLIHPVLFQYAGGAYVGLSLAADSLQPYAGYWLYARQPLTLAFPPPTP